MINTRFLLLLPHAVLIALQAAASVDIGSQR